MSQTEKAKQDAQEKHKDAERSIAELQVIINQYQEQITQLQAKLISWREADNRALLLERRWETTLRNRDSISQFRTHINEKLNSVRTGLESALSKENDLHIRINQIEQTGGAFPQSLLHARDTVEGELLAARYEELSIDNAALYEALLGPLAHAIAVEDIQAAAAMLAKSDDRPETLWLVDGSSSVPTGSDERPAGDILDRDVLVNGASGARLTRLPNQPTLGKRARDQKVKELRQQQAEIKIQIESLQASERDLQSVQRTIDLLLSEVELLQSGDPSERLKSVMYSMQEAQEKQRVHRFDMEAAHSELNSINPRLISLRELAAIAWLLDEPDQASKLERLQLELTAAKAANAELKRIATYRPILENRLDTLRELPLTDTQLELLKVQQQQLNRQIDLLKEAIESIQYLQNHRVALDWTDAQDALNKEAELIPALQAQLERARNALNKATQVVTDKRNLSDSADTSFNLAEADILLKRNIQKADKERWDQLAIDDASDQALSAAETEYESAIAAENRIDGEERNIGKELAKLGERADQLEIRHQDSISARDKTRNQWKPAQDQWEQLQASAQKHSVFAATQIAKYIESMTGKGNINLQTEGSNAATRLKERLRHAKDGQKIFELIDNILKPQDRSCDDYLKAWLEVRDWLRKRVPAQIAEVDEPLEALARLRDHLTGLETRLDRQEDELRGESADVAKNIQIHIHRAQRQINRLSDDLKLVRFGSIHGIKLKLERVPQMENILRALQDGEAQSMLFNSDITIEDALSQLFTRYGGRSTGQRLLDYREYIAPKVMVQRQASTDWEEANPMRMSTGEAIGVGAALMMVVLTAWERDANLLRPKRSQGTLRLLFLDEANRLSQDNLGVLFNLCQNLDLQLMIAAPEVARSEGNTTYRLVRTLSESGREEVLVTGRRVIAKERNADVGAN